MSMKVRRNVVANFVVAVVLLVVGVGCASATTPIEAPETAVEPAPVEAPETAAETTSSAPVEFRLITVPPGGTLDPATASETGGATLLVNAYDKLVSYEGATDEIVSALATTWEVSPDGKEYTFQLREEVNFCDGTPFNAEAVRFNWERNMAVGEIAAVYWEPVESVTVVDDLTVKMTLKTAYALWLNTLAGIYGVHFASPAYVKEHATDDDPWATGWMAEHACGTGPYTLVEYVPGDHLIMEKNPDYWRGWEGKHVDRIVMRFAEEVVTHRALLETGEVDWAQPPMPLEWLDEMKANPEIVIETYPSVKIFSFYFNTRKPPLDNLKVRQALVYAFPYEKYVQEIWKGGAQQAQGNLPRFVPCHNDDLPIYTQDLDKARELLAEAGYPEGGISLTVMLDMDLLDWGPSVLIYQEALKEIGVELIPESTKWTPHYAAMTMPLEQERPYDVTGFWWGGPVPDPNEWFEIIWHSKSFGQPGTYAPALWGTDELDTILDEAKFEPDLDRRCELYKEAQAIVAESAAAIPTAEQPAVLWYRKWLKGFTFNPLTWTDVVVPFYDLYIEGRPE